MNIDIRAVDERVRQSQALAVRIEAVIRNAQSKQFPYSGLDHPTRIFAAILAAQGRELVERGLKQVGLDAKDAESAERSDKVVAFIAESAQFTGTDSQSMGTARVAAMNTLFSLALDMVARAERVLEQEESIDGREIRHGALWHK